MTKKHQIRLLILMACLSIAPRADTLDVPPPLLPWVQWVIHDHQDCPPQYNQSPEKGEGFCRWPSQLNLKVNATQAEFTQKWQINSAGWIALPGSAKHWPQSVQINDTPALVADRGGVPSLFVPKGQLTIQGQFYWEQTPKFLQIPADTGLIALSIDDTPVTLPQLDTQGRLWLHQGSEDQTAVENRLDMRVYRRIIDDIPLQIITRIEMDIAGQQREIVLGPVMLNFAIAMSLNSPLPARLEADGHLRLQVRPGSWTITLHTRQVGTANQLTLAASQGQWVDEEIWVFEARHDLRLVEVSGVTAIDPQQTALPSDWRKLPAYQVRTGNILEIIEKRRGDPEPAPDQLKLQRHFWLDFDGQGYSVQDRIRGTMTRGWRLEMAKPAILGRVAVNGHNQFITQLEESQQTGIEVRRGQINIVADSRLEEAVTQLPAVGWAHDFQQLNATLHLPPGWRLLNATGVDHVPDTWLKQWTLLDLFIVLIMAAAIGKLWHWGWGVLTLATMILIYHEAYPSHWVLLNIIAAIALLRVLPVLGWFSRTVRFYRNISLIYLLIIALPFMMQQVRQSIYPQLEHPSKALEGHPSKALEGYEIERNLLNRKRRLESSKASPISPYQHIPAEEWKLGLKSQQMLRIDPNAQVQTGPGLPQWKWRSITMAWSGPTLQNQSIHLWLLSPTINSILSGVRVVLVAILAVFLLWVSWGTGSRLLFKPKASTLPLLLVGVLLSLPLVSQAETSPNQAPIAEIGEMDKLDKLSLNAFPPQSLLDELQKRLLAPPDCLPHCASSPRLQLELDNNHLTARMEIHSLTSTAVPLPGVAKQWLPQQVLLNGEPAQALLRQKNGQIWLNVTKGIHQVQLAGTLPKRHTVQLPLPLKPHFVEIKATGWRVEGVHKNGIADEQLQFTREQGESLAELEMGNLPPFVQIERTLLLGLEWQIETRVVRQTPKGSAIVLEIPLLKGESVTSENVRVEDGKALINLSPQKSETGWTSVFEKQNTISLTAPDNTVRSEVWRLDASAIWHVEIEGIPVVHHQAEGRWLPQWRPWPGETLTLHLSRPKGVTGQVLTIDRSQLIVSPGQRSTDNQLLLKLRSSRGLQHKIKLPENAQLQSVKINGRSKPIRQEGQFVTLPIMPGEQKIELRFQQAMGMSQYFYTPSVELGIDSVNTHIEVKMPKERWILFTGGKAIGPAVMIWGILIVIILASVGLGQISLTPLKTHHWLLLGVVLSQVPVPLMLCVVAWFMALGWRARMSHDISALKFDAIQIGLGLLTIIALGSLLLAIQLGLLGHPNMHIAGNGSDSDYLRWYEDRTAGILPQMWVYSWSMWIYRIAMLLWALWLSFALLRWLRWGWECFSTHGLWKTLWTKKAVS